MIRKVCPICEQVMTIPHYCKFCRQFVKTPYVRDITYYLNESHPADEKECTYHGVVRDSDFYDMKSRTQASAHPNEPRQNWQDMYQSVRQNLQQSFQRNLQQGTWGGEAENRNSSVGSKKSTGRKSGRAGTLVWFIVVIAVLLQIGKPFIGKIMRIVYWIVWRGFQSP